MSTNIINNSRKTLRSFLLFAFVALIVPIAGDCQSLPDIRIKSINRDLVQYDPQLLSVSGTVAVELENLGESELSPPFLLSAFEDKDLSGDFERAGDLVLGELQVARAIPAGQTITVELPVAGPVLFSGNLLYLKADSANQVAESVETNNLRHSGEESKHAPDPGLFNPVVKWIKSAFSVRPESIQVMMTPAVIDLNGDGYADIVFSTFLGGNYNTDALLRAISGRDGSELWTVNDSRYELVGAAGVAVGDIDNDGKPEIIAAHEEGRLIAFEHDGSFKWLGPAVPGYFYTWGSASLADLDHDGTPEIVFGAMVLNADGTVRWNANPIDGAYVGPLSTVADLDMDGSPEVITGRSAYRADGSLYWQLPASYSDGFPAVGDLDQDGFPEVAVVSGGTVRVIEHNGIVKAGWPVAIPGGGYGGAPTIADVDGDGIPEITTAGANRYVVFKANGQVKWSVQTQDGSSNATGSSVFDFDGDGSTEVIYGDELYLRIYRGSDGLELYRLPKSSCTTYEMPVVVDLEGDGSAEIVAVANQTCGFGAQNGIYVIGSANKSWVRSRSVWNQHSYHITNVNDDGSIPRNEEDNWKRFNNFRQNMPIAGKASDAADLTVSFLRSDNSECNASATLVARVGNGGSAPVARGATLSFYHLRSPSERILIGTATTSGPIAPGQFEEVSLAWVAPSLGYQVIEAVVNQERTLQEGFFDNNQTSALLPICVDAEIQLLAAGSFGANELTWQKLADADSYRIYRRLESGTPELIGTSAVGGFRDIGVVDHVTYFYNVVGVDAKGHERFFSNEASASPLTLACGADTAPQIVSYPITSALAATAYRYQVDAIDQDEGDVLSYELLKAPEAMKIDSASGLITWSVPDSFAGDPTVELKVVDRIGRYAMQRYRVRIAAIYKNRAPRFVSAPILNARTQNHYRYLAQATDPDFTDVLTYSLVEAPNGMSINSTTGRVLWRPEANAMGMHAVVLQVQDRAGLSAEQRYSISVSANQAPLISSTPELSTLPFAHYRYQIVATDPEAETLSYSLEQKPSGMKINPRTGAITWIPETSQIGAHNVRLIVSDVGGATSAQTYTLTVNAHAPPVVTSTPPTIAVVGKAYQYQFAGSDPVFSPLSFHSVKIPTGMSMSAGGLLAWTPQAGQEGRHPVELELRNQFDLKAGHIFEIEVVAPGSPEDPSNNGGPTGGISVSINSPSPGSLISKPTDIFATITDTSGKAEPLSWVADLRREAEDNKPGVEIGSGKGLLTNQLLGKIDPTALANDAYLLYVTVTRGLTDYSFYFPYDIHTQLKLGEFSLTVTDLVIPLSGLNLEVRRSYSSFDTAKQEFGHGWRLALPGRVVDSALESPLETYTANTRVFVTKPDGKRVGFTFAPYPFGFPFPFWKAHFRPDPGVTDVLEAGDPLLISSGGQFYDFGDVYNPSQFTLTTRERVRYLIDEKKGLLEVRDANRNTLTFADSGVVHSSGVGVKFLRDEKGRITIIETPAGKKLKYEYDAQGDLIGFSNLNNEQYYYSYDAAHRLLAITDPVGQVVLTNSFSADGRLVSQRDANGNQVSAEYAADQRTEKLTDRRGHITKLVYDELGGVLERTEPDGAIYRNNFDANGQLTSSRDPLGNESHYAYDAHQNLVQVQSADGSKTHFAYTDLHQLKEVTLPMGQVIRYDYDSLGRRVRERDFSGRASEIKYDSAGNVISVSNSQGQQVEALYNSAGNVVAVSALGRANATLQYDSEGNLLTRIAKRTLPSGEKRTVETRYEYDDQNRPVAVIDAEGRVSRTKWTRYNTPELFVDRGGNRVHFEYDAEGNLLSINYSDGTREKFEYDAEGNQVLRIDRLGNRYSSEYDSRNRLVALVNPDSTRREMDYDLAGRRISLVDESGNRTQYTYNARGAEIERRDAANGLWRTLYDANGRISATIDALGRETMYRYDELGRLVETVFPDGSKQSSEYDAAGRIVQENLPGQRSTHHEYDSVGRLVKLLDAEGKATRYDYDEFDNLVRQTDGSGREISFWYDNVGRLLKTQRASAIVEERKYDSLDNLLERRDGSGNAWVYQYDSNGNRIKERSPNGAQSAYAYDPLGRMLSYTNPLGGIARMTYNYRGDLLRVEDPLGAVKVYDYDSVGNRRLEIDRRGNEKRFSFDALNRVVEERWLSGGTLHRSKRFTYDPLGNRLEEQDEVSHYRYSYDELHRVRSIESLGSFGLPQVLLSQEFDQAGNLVQLRDSLGAEQRSSFDGRGLLIKREIRPTSSRLASVELGYDDAGRVQAIQRKQGDLSGPRTFLEYDARGLESSRKTTTTAGTILHELQSIFDSSLRLQQERENSEIALYGYDSAGQLTSVDYTTRVDEGYTYDLGGNRTGSASKVNVSNQLLEDAEARYRYDLEGNLVARESKIDATRWEFSYDHTNALQEARHFSAINQELDILRYTYDVRGRRIAQEVNGERRGFLYTEEEVWAEFDALQRPEVHYLRGARLDEVLGAYHNERLEWHLTDRQNSLRATVGGNADSPVQRIYSAFGVAQNTAAMSSGYGFQGREYEPLTGLNHFRARSYDAALGRFVSQDPLGIAAGDPNVYRFEGNSPINKIDPFGTTASENAGLLVIPAGVAATVSTATVSAEIAAYAAIEGAIVTTLQAAQAARSVQVLAIVAKDSRLGLTLAKVIGTRLLIVAGALGLRGDQHQEIVEDDGWLLERDVWFVDGKPEAESKINVTREQRRRICPRPPVPVFPDDEKFLPHLNPYCDYEGAPSKSCFLPQYGLGEAISLTLSAWGGGAPSPTTGGQLRMRRCFNFQTGFQSNSSNGKKYYCVTIDVNQRCEFHGWPS